MCIAVYIGSNHELPLVKEADFHVEVARETEKEKFQHILSSPYIYYSGSFEGCGCGFAYESEAEHKQELASLKDNMKEYKLVEADWYSRYHSVELLSTYLADVAMQGAVDVYITWEGEQGFPLRYEATITPDYFGGESFRIEEHGLLKVVRTL